MQEGHWFLSIVVAPMKNTLPAWRLDSTGYPTARPKREVSRAPTIRTFAPQKNRMASAQFSFTASPPARVTSAAITRGAIVSETTCTEPSARSEVATLGWNPKNCAWLALR